MRGFIVLCLSAVAMAAPQGYNYHQQQLSGPGTALGGSFQQFASVQTSGQGAISGFYGSGSQQHQQAQQPLIFTHGPSSGSGYGPSQSRQEPVISKRFYLHSAPEEHDDEYREKHITVGTPKKNYNVVFIKAPAKGNKKTAIKITPAVNEEKTVIYVLSKKTDAGDVHAEIQELPTTTAKPEVFFIKYKTNEEAAHAQEQIQAQYDSLGGSSQVSNEGIAPITSVIGSLGTGRPNTGNGVEHAIEQGSNNNGYLPPSFY